MDIEVICALIYGASVPLWWLLWHHANGFELMSRIRLLKFPFYLAFFYLLVNLVLVVLYMHLGATGYEESRFRFIGTRSQLVIDSTASVLIVATIVYGLTIRQLPVHFLKFIIYGFISILSVMAPIVWIPAELPAGFPILRHIQTVALNYGLFFCVSGIIVLLNDLISHGEATVTFGIDAQRDESHQDEPEPNMAQPVSRRSSLEDSIVSKTGYR